MIVAAGKDDVQAIHRQSPSSLQERGKNGRDSHWLLFSLVPEDSRLPCVKHSYMGGADSSSFSESTASGAGPDCLVQPASA
jgi:hypothetical protein